MTFSSARGVPADHDRQRAVARADVPAGDRRIEGEDALFGKLRRDVARGGRLDGGVVDEDQPVVCAFDDAFFTEHHFFHVGRIGQVGEDHVHLRGDLGGRAGGFCALGNQFVHGRAAAVMHDERESRLEYVPGDGLAHQSQTDVSDF